MSQFAVGPVFRTILPGYPACFHEITVRDAVAVEVFCARRYRNR